VVSDSGVRRVPGLVFSLMLCLSGPQLSRAPIDISSPETGCAVVLGSPTSPAFHIVRAAAKADKTFSSGCLIAAEGASLHPPTQSSERSTARPSDPPNLVLDCPPLAPRPPPRA
jgi:hypothetical protein